MSRRRLLVLATLAVLAAVVFGGIGFASNSDAAVPKPKTVPAMNANFKWIKRADREAAAARAAKQRAKVAGTNQPAAITPAAVTPGGTPDYFGTTPNYATSQLPASVGIIGDGTGANAAATVNPTTGAITSIAVAAGGSGYTAAATSVVIIGGGGSGAKASPVISNGVITAINVTTGGTGYNKAPGIRKFVDTLPLLGVANDLGQKMTVAVPDKTTYPGCDYYEIALVQFTEKMSSDLPATKVRGYVQIDTAVIPDTANKVALTYPNGTLIKNAAGQQVYAVEKPQYMGPNIIAQKGRPVRVKFTNYLPVGSAGDLFIPVDTTIMGAGMGPLGTAVPAGKSVNYNQNRATVHLHGGDTPWISDGTPHQWTTPARETTAAYPKGVSVQYVPDMFFSSTGATVTAGTPGATTNPGAGSLTFYYTNAQGARLMFYHDHSYGITRLNVYAGEAAGYLLQDSVENTLVKGGTLPKPGGGTLAVAAGTVPADEIPLVIQDKTFVPDANQLAYQVSDLEHREVWRSRKLVVPACLHDEPEPPGSKRHEPGGPLGLQPMVLSPDYGSGPRDCRQPVIQANDCPVGTAAESGHSEPVGSARKLHGHAGRERHRLPGRKGRPKSLSLPHTQRFERPLPEPPTLLREVERPHVECERHA